MLDQVLAAFDVTPDHDLDLMQPGQTLAQIAARILAALEPVIKARATGHAAGAGRYHHHASRRFGGLLPTRAGRPCGSRAAHRGPRATISRGDEPRGHHPPRRPAFRAHRNREKQSAGRGRHPRSASPSPAIRGSTPCSMCATPWRLAGCPRGSVAPIGRVQKADRSHRAPPGKLRRRLRAHLRSPGPSCQAGRYPD